MDQAFGHDGFLYPVYTLKHRNNQTHQVSTLADSLPTLPAVQAVSQYAAFRTAYLGRPFHFSELAVRKSTSMDTGIAKLIITKTPRLPAEKNIHRYDFY